MTIDSKMFSCLFIQFFWIDWFAVFDDDMYFFYTREMCFKNVSSIVHADRNDRTPGLFGNFKCTVTEWKHRKFFAIVAGSFREDADGNAIFYIINCLCQGRDSTDSSSMWKEAESFPFLFWQHNRSDACTGCK